MLKFFHFTNPENIFEIVEGVTEQIDPQQQYDMSIPWSGGIHLKPRGLWLSVGNRWFFHNTNKKFPHKRCRTRIRIPVLVDDNEVLILKNADEIRTFSEENSLLIGGKHYIDWKAIAKTVKGIFVFPYIPKHTECQKVLPFNIAPWAYVLDIPSGCVWNTSCISYYGKKEVIRHNHLSEDTSYDLKSVYEA